LLFINFEVSCIEFVPNSGFFATKDRPKNKHMKKTVFTICSVLTVCAVIIMSCEKEDKTSTKVYYYTQPGYSTGGNPGSSGGGTSTGVVTSTSGTSSSGTSSSGTSSTTSSSTTGSGCTTAQSSNGVNGSSASANGGVGTGGTYVVNHNSTVGTVVITFATASAPPAGAYTIVNATPGPGQCSFNDYGTNANGGTVNVSAGTPNGKITYSGIVAGTYTVTGTACY
jgi:hypothetical protein